jgi:predicted ATPase
MQPTPFIGREREVAAVAELIGRKDVRLVTLTGAGGVGKTRLALEVVAKALSDFKDGAFYVPLASVSNPDLVPSTVAQALGVYETSKRTLWDTLKDYFRTKQMLLVLDNFEQVLSAAPLISELLATAPQLQMIVASRAALRIRGEYEFPLLPMALPQATHLPPPKRLARYEAVRLFMDRARAVKPDFEITSENAAAVAELLRRLDGLPLAIELAAARIRFLTPHALLARLTSSLDFLKSGARDLPDRQQTLRDTVDWSYSLLSHEEQKLFARLGVFAGGCTFDALGAVCDPDNMLNAADVAISLADKSLIRHAEHGGETRFLMLDSIREFAQEKLRTAGEADRVSRRHFDYFLRFAEGSDPQRQGPQQMLWLQRLEVEHHNLRGALAWALSQAAADPTLCEGVLRLGAALHWFWFVRGYWREGREWLTKALTTEGRGPRIEAIGLRSARARALAAAGLLAWSQGDVAAARTLFDESIALCQEIGDQRTLAYALAYLSIDMLWRSGAAAGRAKACESVALFREIGDKWGLAYALVFEGTGAYWEGDIPVARARFQESLALFRELGDRWRASSPLGRLGDLAYREGDFGTAQRLYDESLAIYREMEDQPGIISGLNPLGDVARAQGDYEQAARYYGEALALSMEMGDKLNIGWAQYSLAKVAWLQCQYDWADKLLEDSLALIREIGDKGGLAWVLQNLGHLALDRYARRFSEVPDLRRVAACFEEALALAQAEGHTITIAFCLLGYAGMAGLYGEPERAARLWGAAQALREAHASAMSAADRIEYEYSAESVGAQIDQAGHPEAVAEGRALNMQQAIDYAREGVYA